MRQAQYVNGQYLDAPTLNLLATDAREGAREAAAVWALPGLIRPDAAAWSTSGTVVSVSLPPPFAVQFGSGVLAAASGTVDGSATNSYSVDLGSLIPPSGPPITAYIIATQHALQQSIVAIVGPPAANPAYNPGFIAFNSYEESVDSLSVTATSGVPDGVSQIELARTILVSGQSSVSTANLVYAYQPLASRVQTTQSAFITGNTSLTTTSAGKLNIITASGVTVALPAAGTSAGLPFLFATSGFTGFSTIQSNGSEPIAGVAGQPATTTSIALSGASTIGLVGGGGGNPGWYATEASPNFLLALANIWQSPQTFIDPNGLGGAIVSGNGTYGTSIKLIGNGTNPAKWMTATNGTWQVINNAHTVEILSVDDSGNLAAAGSGTFNGTLTTTGSGSFGGPVAIANATTATEAAAFGQVITKINLVVVASSTTYNPSAGLLFAEIEGVAGGGGGGGAYGQPSPNVSAGTGGGSGAYFRKLYTAAQIGASAACVIGAAGTGGAAGQNNGTAGGNTTFTPAGSGAVLSAAGGGGGAFGVTATTPDRGGFLASTGNATGGDLNIAGRPGSWPLLFGGSAAYTAISGNGGNSVWAPGGQSAQENANGNIATGYGAGGGGGAALTGSTSGGNGYQGLIIITEYIAG